MKKLFFVYGTLKVGCCNASPYDSIRLSSKRGVLKGAMLYDLRGFPAVILSKNKEDKVIGELHEYKNYEVTLNRFDQLEGFIKDNEWNFYDRVELEVSGEKAWVYIAGKRFMEAVNNGEFPLIESGEWIEKGRKI